MLRLLKALKLLSFAVSPAIMGLLIAAVVILLFPDRFPTPLQQWLSFDAPKATPTVFNGPVSYAQAVNRAAPSVVNIYTVSVQSTANQDTKVYPVTGSGVIVSETGYIITNLHVIRWATEVRVALQDGRSAAPEIVGISIEDDMAVLKINLDNLTPIALGDSTNVRVGDVALAIGNPLGVGQTVTQGIISATRRNGLNVTKYQNFIQTDAAINPGNSGGALVDAYGNLLGINIGNIDEASGIGFAIPTDRAMLALQDIVEHGRVVRGWLGLGAVDINQELAEQLQLSSNIGVLVSDIYRNSPADIAGLHPFDVITEINEKPIYSISNLAEEFSASRPGDNILINLIRGTQKLQLEAVLSDEALASKETPASTQR
ncbi:MAG: serine protease DegS [Flavobacteriales bacterium]|jgi:serine protease DegS